MSSALIVADIAISVAVVGFAAGISDLLREGWVGQDAVGIQADQFLVVGLQLPGMEPGADAGASDRSEFTSRLAATQQEFVRRLEAEPGIRGVAVGSVLPRMQHPRQRIELDGEGVSDDARASWVVKTARVDVDFFQALEQPILSGRGFDASDLGEDRSAVIVNTILADRLLGGRNPIGRRLRYSASGDDEPGPWYEIVGVVGPLGMDLPTPGPGFYEPAAPGEIYPPLLAVHVGGDPESFTPRVRALADEVDPTAIIGTVVLGEIRTDDWVNGVAMTLGSAVFLGILLMLAASSIYAIMSFSVAERTREIGIRVALGARRSRIAFTVARRALAQLGVGVLLGMPVAGFLFVQLRIGLGNPSSAYSASVLVLSVGVGVVGLIGMLACTAPTLRALRIQPTEALREGA